MKKYYLPGEYEKQKATVLLFPSRTDVWRKNGVPAAEMIVGLANIIADYESVILGILPELYDSVIATYKFNENVKTVKMEYDDSWPRDSVSSVVVGEKSYIASYQFNAYGGELYSSWDNDNSLDEQIATIFNYEIKNCPVTLEGGNMLPDGNGTLFAVKDAIVNDNRNPQMTVAEIEQHLKESTHCEQIVWIPRGLKYDETGGHVDNILAFADSKTLLISYTDDVNDEQYEVVQEIFNIVSEVRNTDGEKYNIVKLPIPPIHYRTEDECEGMVEVEGSFPREQGDCVLETYINFALVNGAVIVPQFGISLDDEALEIIANVFKDRKVIPFNAREATLGGGGFHCLTKHIN